MFDIILSFPPPPNRHIGGNSLIHHGSRFFQNHWKHGLQCNWVHSFLLSARPSLRNILKNSVLFVILTPKTWFFKFSKAPPKRVYDYNEILYVAYLLRAQVLTNNEFLKFVPGFSLEWVLVWQYSLFHWNDLGGFQC